MSIAIISDIHIVDEDDKGYKTFLSFLEHPQVQSADKIFLLGDIFDVMCGPHEEYYSRYYDYFSKIEDLLKQGREIHYFEGNHDLHLQKLYERFFEYKEINPANFFLHRKPYTLKQWGKKYLFCHGDEIEIGNYSYKIYKAIITSPPLRFVANHILPYKTLQEYGENASHASRQRGQEVFDEDTYRQAFRTAAYDMASLGYDYIVCGHSHIKDDYSYNENDELNFTYLNNGFAQTTQSFILLEESGHQFVSLN